MKWTQYRDAYLAWLSLHGSETHAYKATEILKVFTRYLGDIRDAHDRPIDQLEQIDNSVYTKYLARRKQDRGKQVGSKLSVATINGDIRYLNTAFSMALAPTNQEPDRLGLAAPDWRAPHMPLLKEPKRRPRSLHENALQRLFAACTFATRPGLGDPCVWWQTLFLVAYTTGVRCKALLMMPRPTDEDLADSVIRVPAECDKSLEERVFFCHPTVAGMIDRIPVDPGGRLFAWPHCRRYFYTQLHRFQDAAGTPRGEHGLPHDLRRTKATMLIRQGHSLPVVQREMGHADAAVTSKHYVGVLTNEQREAVKSLPMPSIAKKPTRRQLELFSSD